MTMVRAARAARRVMAAIRIATYGARAVTNLAAVVVGDPESEKLTQSSQSPTPQTCRTEQDPWVTETLTKVTAKNKMFIIARAKLALSMEQFLFRCSAQGR